MVNPYVLNDALKNIESDGFTYKLWNAKMPVDGKKQKVYHLVLKTEGGTTKLIIPEKSLESVVALEIEGN